MTYKNKSVGRVSLNAIKGGSFPTNEELSAGISKPQGILLTTDEAEHDSQAGERHALAWHTQAIAAAVIQAAFAAGLALVIGAAAVRAARWMLGV